MFAKGGFSNLSPSAASDLVLLLDMTMALDKLVPESFNWLHTDEGPE